MYQSLYGISAAEYDLMFAKQGGKCATCEVHQSKLKTRLSVDHCHESKRVRGLLCSACNTYIGLVKEDVETLRRMIEYLNATRIESQDQDPPLAV